MPSAYQDGVATETNAVTRYYFLHIGKIFATCLRICQLRSDRNSGHSRFLGIVFYSFFRQELSILLYFNGEKLK